MNILKCIKNTIFLYKSSLIIYIIACLLIASVSLYFPILNANFIDQLLNSPSLEVIYKFCILLIIINIINLSISYFISIFSIRLKSNMSYELNKTILYHIQSLSYEHTKNLNYSYVNQRINSDSNYLISFTISFLEGIIVNILTVFFILIFIFKINNLLFITIVGLDIIYVLVFIKLKPRLAKMKDIIKDLSAKYYVSLQNQIDNIRFFRVNGLINFSRINLANNYRQLLVSFVRNQKYSYIFQGSENIIMLFSQLLLFLIGGISIINGEITIGTFTILSGYFSKLIYATKSLISLSNNYIEANASTSLMMEFLNIPTEKNGTQMITNLEKIEIVNLTFGYLKPLFENFSFKFEKSNIYGITGLNGSGKSSLLDIISGLYKCRLNMTLSYNDILIENVDLLNTYESQISYCIQNPIIIDESILKNITLNFEYNKNMLDDMVHGFQIDYLISRNEVYQNRNVILDELSLGEKQKICLIRTFLKDSSVLLFDEPTSSLDILSKKYFIEKIKSISANKIVIIVTHDLELIKICNKVINI